MSKGQSPTEHIIARLPDDELMDAFERDCIEILALFERRGISRADVMAAVERAADSVFQGRSNENA